MPSPFPGMDPYLEAGSIWPDLHSSLISYIREALQPQVRPKYVARIGERIELVEFGRGYFPDVMVVEPSQRSTTAVAQGAALVADEPMTFDMLDEEQRVPFIEIVYRETGDLVTLIEVLSPANKIGGGREQYLRKQEELLHSQTNLVEIDLLGYGRATALARNITAEALIGRYVVSVYRMDRRSHLEVYPIPLQERLPRCRIPLRPADEDVVLDLPAVFTRCYEVGGYDLLIDYGRAPPVALSKDDEVWLHSWLAEKGLRPMHPQ